MGDKIQGENIMRRGPITLEKTKLNHTSSKGCSKENVTGREGNPEDYNIMERKGGN